MTALVSVTYSGHDPIFTLCLYLSVAAMIAGPIATGLCYLVVFYLRRWLTERARREDMLAVAKAVQDVRKTEPRITPKTADEPGADGEVTLFTGQVFRAPGGPAHYPIPAGPAETVISSESSAAEATETYSFMIGDLDPDPNPTGDHAPGGGRIPAMEYVDGTDVHALVTAVSGDE